MGTIGINRAWSRPAIKSVKKGGAQGEKKKKKRHRMRVASLHLVSESLADVREIRSNRRGRVHKEGKSRAAGFFLKTNELKRQANSYRYWEPGSEEGSKSELLPSGGTEI